ncbi:Unknown protein sequence, partial [Pseudomonas syringae pv. solidagae]
MVSLQTPVTLHAPAGTYRSSRSSVGVPFVTLCVMDLCHAAYSGEDAERP